MQDLIERLEKATGSDHELNLDIFRAIDPYSPNGVQSYWDYTGSLDAALTLVLLGHAVYELGQFSLTNRGWHATVAAPGGMADGKHRTAPLALCIAALRAREHVGAQS